MPNSVFQSMEINLYPLKRVNYMLDKLDVPYNNYNNVYYKMIKKFIEMYYQIVR